MKLPIDQLLRDPSIDQPPGEAQVASDAEVFFAERPWTDMQAVLRQRLAEAKPSWWQSILASGPARAGIGALAAAAALVTWMVMPGPGPSVRPKGAADLSFVIRQGDAVVPGDPTALYRAGDRLQFRYSTATHSHVLIVGRDGKGEVAPWYEDAGRSVAISPGRDHLLSGSVILDETPGPEQVYACFSTRALAVSDLVEPLSRGADAPADCEMVTLTVRKP